MTETASDRAHADLALAVYLEPHAERRRVLLLGEANGALADTFDRLAAHLEIIDPATREPSRGEVPELPFDDREFDLVVVCDANALPEPKPRAVRELRRVLARGGLLAVVNPLAPRRRRRGAPSHLWLEKLLGAEFREVRVLGQQPVSVYALGELARSRGEEFTVDSSLVEGRAREPERLLGLASDSSLTAEPRLWVELPSDEKAEDSGQAGLVDELRRAEDEAREALHRESDLLRKLESERKARLDAEHLAERARMFERKLLAAEADYDDAVARVRYFESVISERDAAAQHDRERREHAERASARAEHELAAAREQAQALEHERDAARSDLEALQRELDEHERRLSELGRELRTLDEDKKHHQEIARDLVEELRRLEHDKSAAVEHDARVAELEAERDRAVQRALDAEVAREAAQMRVDELRAELSERERPAREAEQPHASAFGRDKRESAERERKLSAALESLRERERELEAALVAREQREQSLQAAVEQLSRRESELAAAVERLERGDRDRADASASRERQLEVKLEAYRERERELAEAYEQARERERGLARELSQREATSPAAVVAPMQHELERELLRGETRGLRLRLEESERALEVLRGASGGHHEAQQAFEELRLRLAQAEANLHAMRETRRDSLAPAGYEPDFERNREVEAALTAERQRADELARALDAERQRVSELSRELDEADRFAEVHAEDAERLTTLESELESARDRMDDLGDELRAVDDELRATRNELRGVHEELGRARGDAQRASEEAAAKVELAERREAERDDARAALGEARSILSQLAVRLGADENDPPSIVQALVARDDSRESEQLQKLRSELAQRDERIEQLERWLSEAREPRDPPRIDSPEN